MTNPSFRHPSRLGRTLLATGLFAAAIANLGEPTIAVAQDHSGLAAASQPRVAGETRLSPLTMAIRGTKTRVRTTDTHSKSPSANAANNESSPLPPSHVPSKLDCAEQMPLPGFPQGSYPRRASAARSHSATLATSQGHESASVKLVADTSDSGNDSVRFDLPNSPVYGLPYLQDEATSQDTTGVVGANQSRVKWELKSVADLQLSRRDERVHPEDLASGVLASSTAAGHSMGEHYGHVACWVAPDLRYQALLFEDARLERHGYASPYFGMQPIRSGLHFASSTVAFPFRVWFHRNEFESPLAFERPGSYAAPQYETFLPWIRGQ